MPHLGLMVGDSIKACTFGQLAKEMECICAYVPPRFYDEHFTCRFEQFVGLAKKSRWGGHLVDYEQGTDQIDLALHCFQFYPLRIYWSPCLILTY
jgi:hypothetical protein